MESAITALPSTLSRVLNDVTTGSPTVMASHVVHNVTGGNSSGLMTMDESSYSYQYNVSSTLLTTTDKDEDFPMWLTYRLIIVICVVIGLICLTWASYTIHSRCCSSDQRRHQYQKTLLI